ncbi:hypothetical protein I309_00727 [Cryptococcus deuterogattii LA55]|nr:hypothetical protein I309_00727 [Cryptococcus deuterogattii LA55]KIR36749.1 hypothetical protein I352_00060 [Cryptococcus deuterogattii MMRL2647]KIR69740.1 hypothetical protein I310_06464 [Cryptococcus deuterogattii CA1014]KIR92520.1 hypothetical protein I304_03925 [Cryptococcus deuterogattii CBS 10090]KIS01686.1 hypothetical protein L804_01565 [Cryptococcus deuterogattii 2001/935-1]
MASITPSTIPPSSQSGIPTTVPPGAQSWGPLAIDAAAHGAIAFCQIYYEAYDEPSRRAEEIPILYLPSSKIIWNGNPISSEPTAFAEFLRSMPLSRHDLQTLDCHPVASEEGSAPSLIINVTGSVLHGPAVLQSSNDKPQERDMPRKFHEMFMLKVIGQEEGMQPRLGVAAMHHFVYK